MSRIGEKIKQVRLDKKMNLKQLAKACGVSETYLADVESGKKIINDEMVKKVSSTLGVNLDEPLYREDVEIEEARAKAPLKMEDKKISQEWQSAFSSIIKDIPIYNINMSEVLGYKHLPVIDRKVEGHNSEKVIYIMMPDDTLSGFRVKKGDVVMVILNPEVLNNGLNLVEYGGIKAIKLLKRLDGDKVMMLNYQNELKTETCTIREIKVLGHCLKAEIDLTRP